MKNYLAPSAELLQRLLPASVEPSAVDPITAELVQARLSSIVREMRTIIIRTAYSRMIIEGHDFSSAVLTPQGDLVAASELEQPTHISALSWSARALIAKYGDDIGPGDLYLHNDPYTGGSHLNDVGLFYPVFRGERPLAIIGVMAHWQDVGGMVPGSLSGSAKDIYQEGIRIPSLRIARRGVWLAEVLELLFANVRQPDDRRGDLSAMEGACRIAERRLHAMADRFGDATIPVAFEALLARGERRMRDAIAQLPDGEYAYQTYLDNSGESAEPLLLRLKLTIAGDEIHADFTGSAPQVSGPANLGPAPATTATFTMTKALLDPAGPINAGAQRPLKVTAPLGSVVNARPPAACGAIGEVRRALESLVVGTLGMAIPERLVGDLKGASNIISISGRHPTQHGDFLFAEFPAGGTGGTSRADGNNSMRNFAEGDISSIQPIEAVEASCPLRVERMVLREDGGGPGRHRGGLGLQREIRVLAEHAQLSVLSDKNLIPPYGVRGGWTGAPNRFTVQRDGVEMEPSPLPGKVTGFALRADDIVIVRTAGGGGYGDPAERDTQAVVRDVRFGFVSALAAESVYGVALRDGNEDTAATKALRARLRGQRMNLRAVLLDGEEHAGSRLILRIGPSAAQRLGASDGDLVEVARDDGPSLLGWAHIAADVPDDTCALAASAASLLGLVHDDRIALRRVRAATLNA
jgi:N-methylhydantoinase B